ncbi:MAG: ribonuclease P protein component [Candidatus Anaerobiospirillum merdipullorum]|uniref:Ribonuclease P protein component n=1 Tax=Candidatus Anaerobiospirillum merdipullorum TaxID=2838450 RepID=A0A9E2KNH8_9GAMM|nr:ribonuclease P protein component [Candidatus Anaerobiospirillum merdipullorum]
MSNYSFPRQGRLLSTAEFDAVFKKPVRASAPGIVILATLNTVNRPRLGLVVPKKVLKRAVWRNRVKRVVRETFRQHQATLPAADVVFIAKPKIGEISNQELSVALTRLWNIISRRLGNQQS